jgi:TrwC relaxase
MVMTMAKITAGDGYTYLTRHVAHGDSQAAGARDAAAYYTAQGNPPGRWTGRAAPLLGLADRKVTEEQMLALFGLGEHPDNDAIITAYIKERVHARMSDRQLERVRDQAIAAARLGRPFPLYEVLELSGVHFRPSVTSASVAWTAVFARRRVVIQGPTLTSVTSA